MCKSAVVNIAVVFSLARVAFSAGGNYSFTQYQHKAVKPKTIRFYGIRGTFRGDGRVHDREICYTIIDFI